MASLLHNACLEGRAYEVQFLLDAGVDIESRDANGSTPLYNAAVNDVVELLIARGADVNSRNNGGRSPLIAACLLGTLHTVNLLLTHGSHVNMSDNYGCTPLFSASFGGNVDIVKLLVQVGANVEARTNRGYTALYMAASKGHIEVVQFLIQQHADLNACSNSGDSCLWIAAAGGHTDVVLALLSATGGVNVNLQDNAGGLPLCAASQNGHIDTVRALLSAGADVNLQRNNGFSPLMAAMATIFRPVIDIVTTLLDNGAETETRDRRFGCTALFIAAGKGFADIVDVLIDRGADVNAINYDRRSPVSEAAGQGQTDIVNTLIRHNANVQGLEGDCVDALVSAAIRPRPMCEHEVQKMLQLLINKGGYMDIAQNVACKSALFTAASVGRLDVIKTLVEYGVDIDVRNFDNLHAADLASFDGQVNIVRFLRENMINSGNSLRYSRFNTCSVSSAIASSASRVGYCCNTALHRTTDLESMRSLLENGADVEAENVDGLRPIHYAVRTGLVELVELLIQHGANVDAADVYGNRPLHEAVCHGLNAVQSLVQQGAKLNVQNIDGKTPLHVAVEREQSSEVIVFLLSQHADVGLTDVWRNTPLHYVTLEQLMDKRLQEYVTNQSDERQHMLIRNAVGVTAQMRIGAYGIQRQHIGTFTKTAVYCRCETLVPKQELYVDCYGNTPLHHAVGVYRHHKMNRVGTDVAKTVEFLVNRGADINAQNNEGLTPLHVARGEEATKACLQHADDQSFTITDNRGRNFWHLLFLLRTRYEDELVTITEEIVSDAMHASDDFKRTSLHYACMESHGWFVWLNMAKHFSPEHTVAQDIFGRTALHYAAIHRHLKLDTIMQTLKTKNAAIDTVADDFGKSANDYVGGDKSSISHMDTAGFVARYYRSIIDRVQLCFTDDPASCKTDMLQIISDLRGNSSMSFVLSTYDGCQAEYRDAVCRNTASFKQPDPEPRDTVTNNKESATQQQLSLSAAIQSQVEKAMEYLANEISHQDSRFACEVVPVGSAHEKTKIGCCDEFDYNFVLTSLSRSCKVCSSPESPPGFVPLKAAMPEFDQELFNSNGILNTRIVKFKFENVVKQVVSSLSFCEATGFEFSDHVQSDFVLPRGTTSTKINTQIKLAFTKPVNGCHVSHGISVDVVPALRIDDWWPDDTHREELCQTGDCLIVFTQPQRKYPWVGWTEPHGFVTFAKAEGRLLRDCPTVIKAAYMAVKRLSKHFCQYKFFSPYVIKTALLWCLDDEGFRDKSSASDEVSGDELLRWVQNILRRLLCFAAQDYVPSYFIPKCHQPVWLEERYLKEFHMRLHRHGLTYKDLLSLNEQQSQDRWLQRIKSMFVLSHVMYWTVLSDTDELKLFVPSTINPLAETDLCVQLHRL